VLLLLLVVALAVGCTAPSEWWHNGFKVGPNYRRPAFPAGEAWIDQHEPRLQLGPEDPCHWWQVFGDPQLDVLVEYAYADNLTLRIAATRILEARAIRGVAHGNLFPQSQFATAQYQRIARSANVDTGFPGRYYDDWLVSGTLSWELDFWGRYRRAVEAAQAELDASVEGYDDVLVVLVADVAGAYIEYRSFQQRLALAKNSIDLQSGILKVAQNRFQGGETGQLDVEQAQANLAQTRALIPELQVGLRQASNRLCVLLGRPPVDLSADLGERPMPVAPASVVVGVPGDLLRRRPDVRRAEREVAAASARIGVAQAEFYPSVTVLGTVGVEAGTLSELFSSGSLFGNIGPQVRWNILNYGRLLNNLRVQDARFQNAALTYQETMLQANLEAENAIIAFLQAHEQVRHLQMAVDSARRSEEIVLVQYREGVADYNRVFNIQVLVVQQQDLLARAQRDLLLSLIEVYRSMGGGWEVRLISDGTPGQLPHGGPLLPEEVLPPNPNTRGSAAKE
jgi:NodT family efflux transporter outer membrane factor (OMF) lipoprotein